MQIQELKRKVAAWLDPRPRISGIQLVARHVISPAMTWKFLSLTAEEAFGLAQQDGYKVLVVPQMFDPYSRLDLRVAEIPASLLITFED